jgi:circadian clock protein KaiB
MRGPLVIKLRLYLTGNTPTSRQVVSNLREMLDTGAEYQLEVVDVFEYPEQALDDMVLATPTLIKVLPPPVRRLVGDLSERERVLAGLELLGDGSAAATEGA